MTTSTHVSHLINRLKCFSTSIKWHTHTHSHTLKWLSIKRMVLMKYCIQFRNENHLHIAYIKSEESHIITAEISEIIRTHTHINSKGSKQAHTHTHTQAHTETNTDTDKHTDTGKNKHTHTQTDTQRYQQRQTITDTQTHTDTRCENIIHGHCSGWIFALRFLNKFKGLKVENSHLGKFDGAESENQYPKIWKVC